MVGVDQQKRIAVGQTSKTSYLLEINRRIYATYMETERKVQSCTLVPSVRQIMLCKGRNEFDVFVSQYMEK